MICTSSYNVDFKGSKFKLVALTKKSDFPGEYYSEAAVPESMQKEWDDTLKSGDGMYLRNPEENKHFIREYWQQVLSKLDCEDTYNALDSSIICSEGTNRDVQPCQVVAAWFELFLDETVPSVINKNGSLEFVDKNNFVKQILESTIREDLVARNYTSLRAYYLYIRGRELSKKAARRKLECKSTDDPEYLELKKMSFEKRVLSDRIEMESKKRNSGRQFL